MFYYGDVGYWDGIVRMGHFDGSMDAIDSQRDGFSATLDVTGRSSVAADFAPASAISGWP